MPTTVNGVDPTSATSSLGTSALANSGGVNKQEFLTLLVNQLKAQDPFEPVKNEAFLAQLATFSQLEEQQKTSGLISQLLDVQHAQLALGGLSQAASLVGKEVQYFDGDSQEIHSGVVGSVRFDETGVILDVNGVSVPSGNVVGIGAAPAGTGGSTTGAGGSAGTGSSGTGTGPTSVVQGIPSFGSAPAVVQPPPTP